jgi:hypothetical protein
MATADKRSTASTLEETTLPPEWVELLRKAKGPVTSMPIPPEMRARMQAEAAEMAKARAIIDRAQARQMGIAPAPAQSKRKSRRSPQYDLALRMIDKLYGNDVPDTESTTTVQGRIAAELGPGRPAPSWKVVHQALGRLPR